MMNGARGNGSAGELFKAVVQNEDILMHRALVTAVFRLDQNRRRAAIGKAIALDQNILAHPAFVPAFRVVGEQNAAHGSADKVDVDDFDLAAGGDQKPAGDDFRKNIIPKQKIRTGVDVLHRRTLHPLFRRVDG